MAAERVAAWPVANPSRYARCRADCTVDCGACKGTGPSFSTRDTKADAWAKYRNARPEVLASYREQAGLWPAGHPNAHLGFKDKDHRR